MNNKDRGEVIRNQILKDVFDHPMDLVKHISSLFMISPQAVSGHIRRLEDEERIASSGSGKGKRYFLGDIRSNSKIFDLVPPPEEHAVWSQHFARVVDGLPENIRDICHYGFTEIFNNAIDHSGGKLAQAYVKRDRDTVSIAVVDTGEGIFKKIKRVCNLPDERQAILELSKGKLTTDPANHSGEGIFFTSRVFDRFFIESKGLRFSHYHKDDYDVLVHDENMPEDAISTFVAMHIDRNSKRTLKQVFDNFTSGPDDFNFNKTIIPVKLAQFGDEKLISRSQAKRMLIRVERFKNVVLDFEGVTSIGQAFADEVFRVYQNAHPQIIMAPINMTDDVSKMVNRARFNQENP